MSKRAPLRPSSFELDLEKKELAVLTFVGENLRKNIADHEPVIDPATHGDPPKFAYWGAVVDSLRNVEEAKVRFGGPKHAEVIAFGSNDMFTQGLPDKVTDEEQEEDSFLPHPLGVRLSAVRQVASGGTSMAALSWEGKVYTWGSDDDGVLGRLKTPQDTNDGLFSASPTEVKSFITLGGKNAYGTITQIAVGAIHTLFLSADGDVFISGGFKDSDSGIFSPPDPSFVPTGAPPPEPPVEYKYTPRDNGETKKEIIPVDPQPDTYGIMGGKKTPVHIPGLKNIVRIFSGSNFFAAIDQDRQLWTAGFGCCGELARSSTMATPDSEGKYDLTNRSKGTKEKDTHGWYFMEKILKKFLQPGLAQFDVPGKVMVLNVACGDIHMLVVGMDDKRRVRLFSAGHNNYGQLGHGDVDKSRHVLTPVRFFDENALVVGQVAAGNHHSLALTAAGDALYAWGRLDYGQCGFGPAAKVQIGGVQTTPRRVPMPEGIMMRQVVAGESTSGVITVDGDPYTWGYEGATGHGGVYLTQEDCTFPIKLPVENYSGPCYSLAMGSQFGIMLMGNEKNADGEDESSPVIVSSPEPSLKRQRLE